MNIKTASLALAIAALASCSQNMGPRPLNGVRPPTADVYTARHNVKMICGRAHGESYGFKLLGFIPITSASEAEAVDRMYENARARGAQLEGGPRHFVNTSYEESSNYFIVGSRPVIRVAADLVEVQGAAPEAVALPTPPEAAPQKQGMSFGDIIAAPYRLVGDMLSSLFGA